MDIQCMLGRIVLEDTYRFEDDYIILGYKLTEYDGNGKVISERSGDTMSVGL